MRITIAERLHPFSHENGTKFLLPKSSFSVQVFPAYLYFSDLEGKRDSFSLSFDFMGPLKDFTAELDLERGAIRVFGVTKKGYMHYVLVAMEKGICLMIEKAPEGKFSCQPSYLPTLIHLSKGESFLIPFPLGNFLRKSQERLSLGSHKAQDWTLIRRRFELKEIFPILFSLSHWAICKNTEENEGNYLLLEECRQKIELGEKEKIFEAFQNFILSSFEGVLVPRPYDTEHQGILSEGRTKSSLSSLPLLVRGGDLVRSLFFQERQGLIAILPCLPPQFHCGRMTGMTTSGNVIVDFEWTKKNLRRMQITSLKDGEVHFKLPKKVRSCRVCIRKAHHKFHVDAQEGLALSLKAKETLHLDHFKS